MSHSPVVKKVQLFFESLEHISPAVNLFIRLFIAYFFFTSALTKLSNWEQTVFLFTYEYHVPLLSPALAAFLGTCMELLLPIFLSMGFATRFTTIALMIFNVVALYSYDFLWTDAGYNGYMQHIYYAVLMLIPLFYGAQSLSVDYFIHKNFQHEHDDFDDWD